MVKRLFSGIQPTGTVTIANYLGAIRQWTQLQSQYDSFVSIVDLHAITVPQKPSELHRNIRTIAKLLLACGIEPTHTTLFVQSHLPAHSQLSWILTTLTSMGRLNRMTQFKDKSGDQAAESVSAGLFAYPTLMAADVLLYCNANEVDELVVPVGDDQKQHLELMRDIADLFNRRYGNTFILPTPKIPDHGGRIMSLQEPSKKMSKSDDADSYISLLDSPELIREKLKKAVTDSGKTVSFDPEKKPAISNLITIVSLLTNRTPSEIETDHQSSNYATFKEAVAEMIIATLKPIQERFNDIPDPQVESLLGQSARRANSVAERMIKIISTKVGLG